MLNSLKISLRRAKVNLEGIDSSLENSSGYETLKNHIFLSLPHGKIIHRTNITPLTMGLSIKPRSQHERISPSNSTALDDIFFCGEHFVFATFGNPEGDPSYGKNALKIDQKPFMFTVGDPIDFVDDAATPDLDDEAIQFSVAPSISGYRHLTIRLAVELISVHGSADAAISHFQEKFDLQHEYFWYFFRSFTMKNIQAIYRKSVKFEAFQVG